MSNQNIETLIYHETERRLKQMGKKDYVFPARIGKGDVVAILASLIVCGALIVLCMTGGIQ
ncbi:MAG: hypothetical protein VB055_08740 [Oscillospiraceae bacterium]|nr:hypothetical protein [Oscillospiraceae bacterium]